MRWWSWWNGSQDGLAPSDIRMYVLYQQRDPKLLMERSVGVKNGSYGLVNAEPARQMAARLWNGEQAAPKISLVDD